MFRGNNKRLLVINSVFCLSIALPQHNILLPFVVFDMNTTTAIAIGFSDAYRHHQSNKHTIQPTHMSYKLLLFAVAFSFTPLMAQHISGIFQATDAKMEYLEQLDWESFEAENDRLVSAGFRPTSIETTGIGADRRFWGIYTESTLASKVIKTESWPDFVKAKREMAAEGFLLSRVQAYAINETDARYIGVWYQDEAATPHKIWKLDSPESLRERTDDMSKQQYYLQTVEVFLTPSGTATYLAIYHYSPIPVRNYVFVTEEEEAFQIDLRQRYQSKVRLIDFEQFSAKEANYFLGVYQNGTYDSRTVFHQLRADFNGKWEQLEKENLKLVGWEVRD